MKICDIAQFYSPLGGGVKRYLDEKVRHVRQHPSLEHVLIRPAAEDRVERDGRTAVHCVASPPLPASASYRILLSKRRILEILERERPDVIEVDGPYRAAWIAVAGGRRLGVPVVGFYHSDFPRSLGRTLERFTGRWVRRFCDPLTERYVVGLYNRMAVTVAPSPAVEQALAGCGVERTRTVPLGVDTERFRPRPRAAAALRRELGLEEGDVLLLWVGRLAREKNVAALLDTVALLRRERPDGRRYHLLLVGDGELRDLAEERAAAHPGVHLRPYCERAAELAACYSAADLLLHAGRFETFGLVSIEAQACGTRVLAVRGGGLESTLEGEERPVMSDGVAPRQLAAATLEALAAEGPGSREARRRRIVDRFHVGTTFARMIDLYGEVIERAGSERESTTREESEDDCHGRDREEWSDGGADEAEVAQAGGPTLSLR